MHRVNLLRHYGVKPILVFDGGLLPMKIEQENKRARYGTYLLTSQFCF
jgi:exonuclease-1